MATNTPIKMFRGAASLTTTTVLYTVPASTTAIVTNIVVTNTAGSAGTFTIGMGTAGSNTSFATTVAIAANAVVTFDIKQTLVATETITGGASATSINFAISGMTQV
jgi:hypothetical protein